MLLLLFHLKKNMSWNASSSSLKRPRPGSSGVVATVGWAGGTIELIPVGTRELGATEEKEWAVACWKTRKMWKRMALFMKNCQTYLKPLFFATFGCFGGVYRFGSNKLALFGNQMRRIAWRKDVYFWSCTNAFEVGDPRPARPGGRWCIVRCPLEPFEGRNQSTGRRVDR